MFYRIEGLGEDYFNNPPGRLNNLCPNNPLRDAL